MQLSERIVSCFVSCFPLFLALFCFLLVDLIPDQLSGDLFEISPDLGAAVQSVQAFPPIRMPSQNWLILALILAAIGRWNAGAANHSGEPVSDLIGWVKLDPTTFHISPPKIWFRVF